MVVYGCMTQCSVVAAAGHKNHMRVRLSAQDTRKEGREGTCRVPGRESRAAQHVSNLAICDLEREPVYVRQCLREQSQWISRHTLFGSATPGHHGLDALSPRGFRSSFDATGSVCASLRSSRTPRTSTFMSFSVDRYLPPLVSFERWR